MAEEQKAKNLYKALTNDQSSNFYTTDKITRGLIRKAKTSLYPKDKVFVNIYNKISNESGKKLVIVNENPPLNTPFVEKREDVDRSTLYSFSGPFEALQAGIAEFNSWVDQQPIQNIVIYLLICSLL